MGAKRYTSLIPWRCTNAKDDGGRSPTRYLGGEYDCGQSDVRVLRFTFVQSFEQTVREALETQMFLVQETGPTSFVIKQDGSDAKFKVSREFSAGHLLAVGTQSVSG